MDADTLIAMAGLTALAAAALTGAVWDSALVSSPVRVRPRSRGRHALDAPTRARELAG
ncbi:hypothetical protein SAMN04489835_5318 [Mycolicibacterium rutilum]|uniref:Uncharacterized protein n=1 Tax=Mycolicibacterium rutilum TaxID=370526 RepID=A0A1H6LV40_MYCRU|nr:hypothetical protein SAMN04489835_5318 [Mycolicibacterium rutilum]